MNENKSGLGVGLVLLSALMLGSYGVWSRLIGPAMGSFYQGWTRALLILLLLVPIAFIRKEIIKIRREDKKWLITFLIFTSLTQAPLFYAFNHMDIGTATLLFFVSMFITMNVVGIWFLGEKITYIKVISAILALIGMYLVFSFSIVSFSIFAAFMAIANGVASGGEVAFSKKLTNQYSPLYIVILSWAIILITNLIISLSIGEPQIAFSMNIVWLWQLFYSIASLFGFWLVIAGLSILMLVWVP